MSRLPRISEAEWDVMSVLWAHEHAFAQEVASELAPRKDWNQRTVKTLLGRLVKKGALGFEVDGPRYRYHALVTRDECLRAESRSLLERFAGGSISPLLAQFVREGKLTPDEIAELKDLLAEKEEEEG